MAVGDNYLNEWYSFCRNSWVEYATKFGFDLFLITDPIDVSEFGLSRNLSWQKCLIFEEPEIASYNRVIWMDADIIINPKAAPDISLHVPPDKIGATDAYSFFSKGLHDHLYTQYQKYCSIINKPIIINSSPQDYYLNFGLENPPSEVVQCGVLVLSPEHRFLLQYVYDHYEEKVDDNTGYAFNYEMRPLSYHILKENLWHPIDERFNLLFNNYTYFSAPFLAFEEEQADLKMKQLITTSAYCNSFFLHFAGGYFGKNWMKYVLPNTYELKDFK